MMFKKILPGIGGGGVPKGSKKGGPVETFGFLRNKNLTITNPKSCSSMFIS